MMLMVRSLKTKKTPFAITVLKKIAKVKAITLPMAALRKAVMSLASLSSQSKAKIGMNLKRKLWKKNAR